jgi:hypothetical protein
MKTSVLSALMLLLVAALLRADPPGVVERLEKEGKVRRDPKTGQVNLLVLSLAATDDDLAVLCELRGLRTVDLNRVQVTDEGLRTIAALPQVSELSLVSGQFTDAGLRHLEAMRGLRELYLWSCPNVTAEGVARLKKALPDCTIDYRP